MSIQVSDCGNYKKMELSLYRLDHGFWHHVCCLPASIDGIDEAVKFYYQIEEEEEA